MPVGEARLPLTDRGVLFGLGFFETFRTSGGRPHHWSYNRHRLSGACQAAGLTLPPSFLAIDEARLLAVVTEILRTRDVADAVFRYTLTAGRDGERPAEFLTLRPLPPTPPPAGIALRVLRLARDNGEWLPRPKSLNYANAFLGAAELARRSESPSDEGLFLSREGGFVVETPRQSLAWFADGCLCYPDPALGPIAGTCLQWLLDTCRLPAEPRRAPLAELLAADAVFVLNAVRGVTPVHEVWDVADRTCLATYASAAHPRVVAFRESWSAALRATAATP